MIPPPPTSTLFPYTTLFRSNRSMTLRRPMRAKNICYIKHCSEPGRSISMVRQFPRSGRNSLPEFRSEEHTSELQSLRHLVCRLLLEKKKKNNSNQIE